ncbi:DUF885 family protein [Chiayiivirga flava]|uniref:Uncharacterized protein (DUF885 family) n=1 Tax=Chiayiivirga flava TaxID=659595 RepID=A0A7W8DAF4_9GAMM|nr:uncharacterized protein (DUF885 family) [Chiayiivirga flava]
MTLRLLVLSLVAALAACSGSQDPGAAARGAAPAAAHAPAATPVDGQAPAATTARQLDALYEEYWQASLELNPLQATFVGDPRYNDRMPDFLSAQFRKQAHAFDQDWLDRVSAIDPATLDGQARISYDMFVRDLKTEIEAERFPTWMLPIDQFRNIAGFAAQLGSGTGAQPFKTVQDYDNWLKRAAALPGILDTAIANMREGVVAGVVQPTALMQKVLPQLDALIKDTPEDTLFWNPIASLPEDVSEADTARLTQAYRTLITEQLMPAYRRLRSFIAEEYLPATRSSVALSALPDGEAWYAFNVRNQTTTDLTPAQIHQIGLDEVARIHGEMERVMREVGFEGSLRAFFEHVTTDPSFKFESEAALLEAYNGLRARVEAGVPALFSLTPKAAFEIRPVEAFRAASAAGGSYMSPSEDGSRPGIFYVNTHDLPSRKTWDMESLFLHEAIPGHHFQIALQQELTALPKFRRFGGETAFAEGWGLYAESLGKELGVYTDPYQYFGRLQAELWRAIRLVVDTGLHSRGWTREQVIDYMKANSATSDTEAVAEAERYIAMPGQALAYKIGELKIRQLRERAETALGARFDIRAFHAEVLRDGAVPLDVLEAKIERWLAAQPAG